uniref:Uncharacterized protein n=1 Tax=Arundo donax TaxID=35708 RepID=A0A0A9C6J5_ARUDO
MQRQPLLRAFMIKLNSTCAIFFKECMSRPAVTIL